MAEETNISWADATLNFWVGCTKVSIGEKGACTNCYAETWAKRWPAYKDTWGPGATRVQFKHLLAKAMKLERLAIAKLARGEGAFFCFSNSLSDIFDNEVPIEWLVEAFDIMRATPHVTYLLLTKRPQNIVKLRMPWPRNVAIGCTVVTQKEADRDIPWLLGAKAILRPAFAFLSMEPLMEVVDIRWTALHPGPDRERVDWVITGGESGPHARPTHPDGPRSIRDQCAAAGVPYHHKQNGEWEPNDTGHAITGRPVPRSNSRFDCITFPDGQKVNRVGKKASGCLLDGVVHNARPIVS